MLSIKPLRPFLKLRFGVLGLSIVVGLLGCGSMDSLPSDTYYRLSIASKGSNNVWSTEPMRIAKFHATGLHKQRELTYLEGDRHIVKQHTYHLWVNSPEQLLQDALVSYLRGLGASAAVTSAALTEKHYEIRGTVREFDHVLTGSEASVTVALSFEVLAIGQGTKLVLSRDYGESVEVADDAVGSAARSLSVAASTVFDRFASDARQAVVEFEREAKLDVR